MKKLTKFLLKKYSQMSGDQKIRLGISMSEMARRWQKDYWQIKILTS